MNATEAVDQLDPKGWAETTPAERLRLLEEVRTKDGQWLANREADLTKWRTDPLGIFERRDRW